MKNVKHYKFIAVVLLLMELTSFSFSQNQHNNFINQQKYWYYRNRLRYFVVPGSESGESMMADRRNVTRDGENDVFRKGLSWGQHGVYFGYYLGVLSTEFFLLKYYNQDYTKTISELNLALNAYIERMDKCEALYYEMIDKYDGFFIRDDITCNFKIAGNYNSKLNHNLDSNSTWPITQDGRPGYVDHINGCEQGSHREADPMSQDEAIGILKGLALVYRCFPENSSDQRLSNIHWVAKEIALKIINYIHNNGSWNIETPIGPLENVTGGDATFYAYAFSYAGVFFGENWSKYFTTPKVEAGMWANWGLAKLQAAACSGFLYNCSNKSMAVPLGIIGKSWDAGGIYNASSCENWDGFYMMYYEFIHCERTNYLNKEKIRNQIDNAPCYGPFCFQTSTKKANYDWAGSYKYEVSSDIQENGDSGFEGVYNGLDYLLIYNLYHIISILDYYEYINGINERWPELMPAYENMVDMNLNFQWPLWSFGSDNNPRFVNSFSNIESTDRILVDEQYGCGNLTYRAADKITLKPGFKVSSGAKFHAYIRSYSCSNWNIEKSQENINYDLEFNSIDSAKMIEFYFNNSPYDNFESPLKYYYSFDKTTNESNIKIFPNPARNSISIANNVNDNLELKLFDILGNHLMTQTINKISLTFDISSIKSGIYICSFYCNGEIINTQKLTIIK